MESKEIKITERLAFHLFQAERIKQNNLAADMSNWRSSDNDRSSYRQKAGRLIAELERSGIRISVNSPSKLESFITELITKPAEPAYDPVAELTSTEDSSNETS